MPTLSLTKTASNGVAHDASHVNTPFTEVETWANTTKLDYLNIQDNGLRVSGLRTHANVEGVRIKVRNATGSSIAANSLVYFSGTYSDGSNNYPTITKAISTTAVGSTYFAQAVTSATIADGTDGTAAIFMELSSQNTSSGTVGDLVYLDTTAGGWTRTRPTGGQYVQVVGTITVVHASTGRIVLSLGAVPEHLTGGSSGLGATFQTLTVQGASGAAADIYHFGDAGEDNADKWKISVADGGVMTWENYTSGSYAAKMTITSAGVFSTAGAITSSGAVTGSSLVGTITTAAQNSITSASSLATVGTITSGTWSGVIDGSATITMGSDATGDMYYRAASTGYLTRLAAGADGTVLTGTGAGSIPAWETLPSSGISWDGSTANGVATYKDGDEATVESNLTFDGSILSVGTSIAATADTNTSIGFPGSDIMTFSTGGVEGMRLNAEANLGIKTNPAAAWHTDQALIQLGTAAIWTNTHDETAANSLAMFSNNLYQDSADEWRYIVTDESSRYYQNGGGHYFDTAASGSAGAAVGFTNRMVIDSGGDVGIGTTAPFGRLNVHGAYTAPASGIGASAVFISSSDSMAANVGGILQFGGRYNTTGGGAITQWAGIQGLKENGTNGQVGGYLGFVSRSNSTGIAETWRITSTGQLTASYRSSMVDITYINVNTSTVVNNEPKIVLASNTASSTSPNGEIRIHQEQSPHANYRAFVYTQSSSNTQVFRVMGDGDCENANNSYGSTSDLKLKQDITDARSYWDDFKLLQFKKFRFKKDVEDDADAPYRFGLIAQEVEPIFPSIVKNNTDIETKTGPVLDDEGNATYEMTDEVDDDGELIPALDDEGNPIPITKEQTTLLETTTKSLKYSVLSQIGLKVVQELQTRLEAAEAEIAALKSA